MAANMLGGVGGVARKIKAAYAGVDGVAREITKAYAGVNGIAQLAWQKETGLVYELSYSGAHTRREVTYGGTVWDEWTLTGSGTLTKTGSDIPGCGVVVISGGAAGCDTAAQNTYGRGGPGGFLASNSNYSIVGNVSVTVGAGATTLGANSGASSFGSISASSVQSPTSANKRNGGTGGGGRNGDSAGVSTGDGIQKRPFGDTVNWPNIPCAGGGAGANQVPSGSYGGGNGGSNGGNGSLGAANVTTGGTRGTYGGGWGGDASSSGDSSTNASYYGGGGGGKASYNYSSVVNNPTGVRAGYQGVVILRVPLRAA